MLLEIGIIVLIYLFYYFVWHRKNTIDSRGLPIFISGCDTGIGHRLAILFSEYGCQVFAGCLDPEKAFGSLPKCVHIIPLDITDHKSVQSAVIEVQKVLNKKGTDLWALINNAGVCVYGPFEWQTWDQCEKQISVNVLGTIRLTKAFLPLLRKAKGRVITMSSINGRIAYPNLSIYSASKFALEGFNDALRVELGKEVRTIVVQPGDFAKLTSIMSRHEQNAQEMWDHMDPEHQLSIDHFFHKFHQKAIRNSGLTSPNSFEHSNLLNVMQDAVLSRNPKRKYVSASITCRIFYIVLYIAPDCVKDFVFQTIEKALLGT